MEVTFFLFAAAAAFLATTLAGGILRHFTVITILIEIDFKRSPKELEKRKLSEMIRD